MYKNITKFRDEDTKLRRLLSKVEMPGDTFEDNTFFSNVMDKINKIINPKSEIDDIANTFNVDQGIGTRYQALCQVHEDAHNDGLTPHEVKHEADSLNSEPCKSTKWVESGPNYSYQPISYSTVQYTILKFIAFVDKMLMTEYSGDYQDVKNKEIRYFVQDVKAWRVNHNIRLTSDMDYLRILFNNFDDIRAYEAVRDIQDTFNDYINYYDAQYDAVIRKTKLHFGKVIQDVNS